MLKKTDVAFFQ